MSAQSLDRRPDDTLRTGFLGLVGVLIALVVFSGTLAQLADRWASQEEYSHGFLIPIVAIWLLWLRRDALRASVGCPVWAGPGVILLAAFLHLIGVMSATPFFSQLAFVLTLVGLVLALGGYPLLKTAAFPILFLLFAIPMPRFIDYAMSLQLQLLSTQLGALFIKLFGIPVYVDGNVIDLGYYKVQIVEACSGLRYIYPLLSLSFLAAYFFKAPLWQRILIFVSAVPLTVVMNSIRIGLVGITVSYWGNEAADGFFHLFEGWIVFLACAGVLGLEIHILARMSGKSFSEVFFSSKMKLVGTRQRGGVINRVPFAVSFVLLCAFGFAIYFVSVRSEISPDRPRFVAFPGKIAGWQGQLLTLDPGIEGLIRPDDYLLSDYRAKDGKLVNFYVAYYASQRNNDKPHSPSECMPANGWDIKKFERTTFHDGFESWPINRAVIEKNSVKQLVYYWFDERGRKIANEYFAKWYLHTDAVLMNRTDGALVRLITQVYRGETEEDADRRLQAFIHDTASTLSDFLPSRTLAQTRAVGLDQKIN